MTQQPLPSCRLLLPCSPCCTVHSGRFRHRRLLFSGVSGARWIRPRLRIMHVCTEHRRVSDFLHHSLMMSKDKIEVTGKILNLTLEIIFLLTGEDFVLRKRQNDQSTDDCQLCLSDGSTKDRIPSEQRPCPSPAHEETPEPGETPHSSDEEIPVRCEDVAVFFSVEEWKYLEGHKERYKDVVPGNNPPPGSAGCDEVSAAETAADEGMNTLQVDAAADAPLPGGHIPTKPPESIKSPLVIEEDPEEDTRMVTQEYQAHLVKEISPPRCKEEDAPVQISSGDHGSVNSPEISGSPICIEDDTEMILEEYQAEAGDIALPDWCKEERDPPKRRSGLPTTWKVQPESPHLLIPIHHKNGVIPTKQKGNTSRDCSPKMVVVKPKNAQNEAPPLRSKTNLPTLLRNTPHVDASSSNLMTYRGGAVNVAPALEILTAHKCLQCGRGFRSESDLISHHRTHEKVYHCALCQQTFMDKSALVVHEWSFHLHEPKVGEPQPRQAPKEERPFSCLECGKSFMKKSSLVKHQRIHTGAFACPDCGKCLSDKTGLIIHRRTHTGEKPFSCSECGRRFTQMCHLITHQSVHTGKGSFICSDCGKCFSIRSVLEAHQALHNRHRVQRFELTAHVKDSDSTS
ncbi:oocyte zinc finger protein XlCOF7.1-like [Ranitomeya imitator]|uniref:oocyte zinc finger protein XlCOF7.1-like n=1 Tax=Ranitomeya imitator TaxID=111125 RepID=UPI0037E7A9B8